MAQFSVNAQRFDPYKNFKFRIKWDGRYVAGVSKVGALRRSTDLVEHREGGDPSTNRKSPGRTKYEAITLERGVTHDTEFERWANMVHPYAGDAAMDLVNYKQELTLEVMDEKGLVALRYFLHRCWVSEFVAVPDLDSMANVTAIESVKLELEGWERDVATVEPDEASAVPVGA